MVRSPEKWIREPQTPLGHLDLDLEPRKWRMLEPKDPEKEMRNKDHTVQRKFKERREGDIEIGEENGALQSPKEKQQTSNMKTKK